LENYLRLVVSSNSASKTFEFLTNYNHCLPQTRRQPESLGATAVFDRNLLASNLTKEIKKLTNEPIKLVYDLISSNFTQETGAELLAPGGQLAVVLPVTAKAG